MGVMQDRPMPGTRVRCQKCDGNRTVTRGWFRRVTITCPTCNGRGFGIATYPDDGLWPRRLGMVVDYKTPEVLSMRPIPPKGFDTAVIKATEKPK